MPPREVLNDYILNVATFVFDVHFERGPATLVRQTPQP